MGILRTEASNALFLPAWNEAQKRAKPQDGDSDRQKAMEAFAKAMRDCDKAMENVMDKHHESVAKSAQKRDEYRKKRAQQERLQKTAEARRDFNRQAVAQAQERRELTNELRIEAAERQARFDMRA